MRRKAVSSVLVAAIISIILALGIWGVLGVYAPAQGGLFTARILVVLAFVLFAATLAVWSRIRKKSDQDL